MNTPIKMKDADYFAVDAISKSLLSRMDCPAKAMMPMKETKAMQDGSMIHCAVLETDAFYLRYIVAPEINKRTKAGKEEWELFRAENADKLVITQEQYDLSMAIKKSILAHPTASELLSGGDSEMAYFWKDERMQADCKCKADYVKGKVCVDLKTCASASPKEFSRTCSNFKYAWQAVHYMRGTGAEEFVFIAVEKTAPYVVECYRLSDEALSIGARQLDEAMDTYLTCKALDDFCGYNDNESVTTLDLPAWDC